MIADSVYFKGYRCFNDHWAGFEMTKPINVIIGRNNSGKSHLMDLVRVLCSNHLITNELANSGCRFKARGVLSESALKKVFPPEVNPAGVLGFNPWSFHGHHFVGVQVEWEFDDSEEPANIVYQEGFDPSCGAHSTSSDKVKRIVNARNNAVRDLLKSASHKLSKTAFRELLSERDIRQEPANTELNLGPRGEGATNIVRRFMLSSNESLPRESIRTELRSALNDIFGRDGDFIEVQPIHHDDDTADAPRDHWEIFLNEDKKGLIPLTRSGSGLKTVLLVLLNLIAVPHVDRRRKSSFTFVFEELENNLHPAILRRLFKYLEDYAVREQIAIFLTTHSSVALDCYGRSDDAQVIHVSHNGDSARTQAISTHLDRIDVVSQLGAKASDLLQSNGIIWVEGPSDRIYVNRWIEIIANGEFQEGRDYQCAFYGGALLARAQFTSPEEADPELANLWAINPNVIVVCDSDRTRDGDPLKRRVERILEEVSRTRGHAWITDAKEIENYVPGCVLAKAFGLDYLPDPEKNESLFHHESGNTPSYFENHLDRVTVDKVELANLCAPHISTEIMAARFDWEPQMREMVGKIEIWNS